MDSLKDLKLKRKTTDHQFLRVNSYPDLTELGHEELSEIKTAYRSAGALLLRSKKPVSDMGYLEFVKKLDIDLSTEYAMGLSPRQNVEKYLFTSTEAAEFMVIGGHTEMCYQRTRPEFISFYCKTEPEMWGETPVVDCEKFLGRLRSEIRTRLEKDGVAYRRFFRKVQGKKNYQVSWSKAFGTADRLEIEQICREAGLEFEWTASDDLITWNHVPAVIADPVSGTKCLNINMYHLHCHLYDRQMIAHRFNFLSNLLINTFIRIVVPKDNYFVKTLHGNKEPFTKEEALDIYAAMWASTDLFDWRQNDILLLNNIKAGHGRLNVKNPREILTIFGDNYDSHEYGVGDFIGMTKLSAHVA